MAELFFDQILAALGAKKEPQQKGLLSPQQPLSTQEKLAVQPNLYQDFWTQNPAAVFNPANPFAYSAAQKEAPEIAQNWMREIPIGLAATPGAVVDIAAAPFKGLLKGGLNLAGQDKLAEDISWFPLAEASADAARNVIEGKFGKAPELKSPEAISAELTGEAILDPLAAMGGVSALREGSKIPGLLNTESAIPGPVGRPAVGASGRPTGAIEYPAVPDANQVIAAERQAARVGPRQPAQPPAFRDPRFKAAVDPETGMYSPVEEALLNLRQETMTPQQARSYLTNQGLSRGQLEDSGVWDDLQWAQDNNQRVTKTGLLDTISTDMPQQEFQVRSFENKIDADVGLDWDSGEVLDDYEYINANANDLAYDALSQDPEVVLAQGGGYYRQQRKEIAEAYANGDEELAQQIFEELENASLHRNRRNLSSDADEALGTWAETRASEDYYDNPQYQWDFDVTGQGDYYTVRGGDDVGYWIEDPNGRQVGDFVWDSNEAEVRIREDAFNRGLINPSGGTKWHQYTMGDLYDNDPDALAAANYEEILVQAPPIRGGRDYTPSRTHWDDEENIVYHVRKTDRTGDNGEQVLFIEELQSDWHQAGRQKGYDKLSADDRRTKLSEYERAMNRTGAEIKDIEEMFKTVGENPELNPRLNAAINEIAEMYDPPATRGMEKWNLARNGINDALTVEMMGVSASDSNHEKLMKMIQETPEFSALKKARMEYRTAMQEDQAIRSMIPQGAFADDRWISQGMKQMLAKAAQEGKDGVAWTTSQHQVDQWSERYRKLYETLYDKKMPSAAKKLADEYGLKVKKIEVDDEEVMYLELNDKARKRILERGIEMSSAAPLIPGAGLLADQQDNKQNQPTPGLLA